MIHHELAHLNQTLFPRIGVQHLYKSMILALMTTLALSIPAAAQKDAPSAEPQPTTFQRQAAPLDALLNDGWFVHSVTGGDGEILLLFKKTKFVRCYLSGPRDSQLRLDLAGMVFSTCHALN